MKVACGGISPLWTIQLQAACHAAGSVSLKGPWRLRRQTNPRQVADVKRDDPYGQGEPTCAQAGAANARARYRRGF